MGLSTYSEFAEFADNETMNDILTIGNRVMAQGIERDFAGTVTEIHTHYKLRKSEKTAQYDVPLVSVRFDNGVERVVRANRLSNAGDL